MARKKTTSEERLIDCLKYCYKSLLKENDVNAWRMLIRHFSKEQTYKIKELVSQNDYYIQDKKILMDNRSILNRLLSPLEKAHQGKIPFGFSLDLLSIKSSFVVWANGNLTDKERALCIYIFQDNGWMDWKLVGDKEMDKYICECFDKGLPNKAKEYLLNELNNK